MKTPWPPPLLMDPRSLMNHSALISERFFSSQISLVTWFIWHNVGFLFNSKSTQLTSRLQAIQISCHQYLTSGPLETANPRRRRNSNPNIYDDREALDAEREHKKKNHVTIRVNFANPVIIIIMLPVFIVSYTSWAACGRIFGGEWNGKRVLTHLSTKSMNMDGV